MDTAQISEQEKVIYQENAIVSGVISSGPCIASKVSDDISGFSWMNIHITIKFHMRSNCF